MGPIGYWSSFVSLLWMCLWICRWLRFMLHDYRRNAQSVHPLNIFGFWAWMMRSWKMGRWWFFLDFYSWAGVILRSAYESGNRSSLFMKGLWITYNSINYFLMKVLLRELYFTGAPESVNYCSLRNVERLGEYVDGMVIQLVEWFWEWNESAKRRTEMAVSTRKFSALPCCQPGTNNKISAVSLWAEN